MSKWIESLFRFSFDKIKLVFCFFRFRRRNFEIVLRKKNNKIFLLIFHFPRSVSDFGTILRRRVEIRTISNLRGEKNRQIFRKQVSEKIFVFRYRSEYKSDSIGPDRHYKSIRDNYSDRRSRPYESRYGRDSYYRRDSPRWVETEIFSVISLDERKLKISKRTSFCFN